MGAFVWLIAHLLRAIFFYFRAFILYFFLLYLVKNTKKYILVGLMLPTNESTPVINSPIIQFDGCQNNTIFHVAKDLGINAHALHFCKAIQCKNGIFEWCTRPESLIECSQHFILSLLVCVVVIFRHLLSTTMSLDIVKGLAHGMNVHTFNKPLYLVLDTRIDLFQNVVDALKFLRIYGFENFEKFLESHQLTNKAHHNYFSFSSFSISSMDGRELLKFSGNAFESSYSEMPKGWL